MGRLVTEGAEPPTAVLSMRPEWARRIVDGAKTLEVRRRGCGGLAGRTILIYATAGTGAIVGEIRIGEVRWMPRAALRHKALGAGRMTGPQYDRYMAGARRGQAVEVVDATGWAEPVTLEALRAVVEGWRPPQIWRRIEGWEWVRLAELSRRPG